MKTRDKRAMTITLWKPPFSESYWNQIGENNSSCCSSAGRVRLCQLCFWFTEHDGKKRLR